MATSANERFERLFANKPRPMKPDVGHSSKELGQSTIQQDNCDSLPSSGQAKKDMAPSTFSLNSSEDDEYTALFTKKPEMKTMPTRIRLKPEAGALGYPKDANIVPLQPIEYIPEGKRSTVSLKSNEIATPGGHDETVDILDVDDRQPIGRFCVFSLVAKFPYKYMSDPNDRVSRHFFADNKFYDRTWNLHYLHPPQSFDKAALLLVPLTQVQQLVNEISSTFKIAVNVPPFPFTLKFYDDNTPQPVYLGMSVSRQDVGDLTAQIPVAPADHGECPLAAAPELVKAYELFHKKIEIAILASKGKSKNGNANQKKGKKLLDSLQESRNQLRRAQRYFGLRPQTRSTESAKGLSWEEEKAHKKIQEKMCGLFFDFLDVEESAKYPFEHAPVIVSVDIESYERNHGFVTEIGISILDTLDIVDLPPGPTGSNWTKQIRSRHIRIKGREHLVNTDFVAGNPDAFQFGKSEFCSLDEVAEAVDSCFEWPYSVQFKIAGAISADRDGTKLPTASVVDLDKIQKGQKERNILLLGHDIGMDLDYLHRLGSEIFNPRSTSIEPHQNSASRSSRHRILTSILETLDTATLYKIWKEELQPRNLGYVCDKLGIDPWFLHNAGNDARYTLEALIKILIQSRLDEDNLQKTRDPSSKGVTIDDWEAEKMRHVDARLEAARQKLEKKIIDHTDETLTVNSNTEVQHEIQDESLGIDWSAPLPGEKTAKKRRHKKQETSTW